MKMSETDVSCPLTTLLYAPNEGFYLLSRHIARLQSGAVELFSRPEVSLDVEELTRELEKTVGVLGSDVRQRIRVVLSQDLQYKITSTPLPKASGRTFLLRLDTSATDLPSRAIHKTTSREVYDSARARVEADYTSDGWAHGPPFDVLMWNIRGDVTETSIANFAVFLDGSELQQAVPEWNGDRGVYVTPRADKGLIAGIMRAELLEDGTLVEGDFTREDVLRYARCPDRYPMICFNAVRGVYKVHLDVSLGAAPVSPTTQPVCVDIAPNKNNTSGSMPASKLFLDIPDVRTGSPTPDTTPCLTPVSSARRSSVSSAHHASKPILDEFQQENDSPFVWRRGVIIDCYDSYTNNLLQLFDQEESFNSSLGSYVTVLRADQVSWSDFEANVLPHLDFVILSPGPGSPHVPADIGVGGNLLLAMASERLSIQPIPVLGVCLGHQALAALFGGKVVSAGELVHGRTVPVRHEGSGLFEGLPVDRPLRMVRYNSLTVDASTLPNDLEVIATNPDDGEIMGLKHKLLPLYGVQFHPESICSRRSMSGIDPGKQILRNFMKIVDTFWSTHGRPNRTPLPSTVRQLGVLDLTETERPVSVLARHPSPQSLPDAVPFRVVRHSFGAFIPPFARTRPDLVFEATSYSATSPFFWLDSAASAPGDTFARFSYMGPTSPKNCISYDLATHSISCGTGKQVSLSEGDSFWHWMDRVQTDLVKRVDTTNGTEGLRCGFVGYFGYEMKAGALPGYVPLPCGEGEKPDVHAPDAQFMFADRVLAYDHWNHSWSVLGLVRRGSTETMLKEEIGMEVGMDTDEFESWVEGVKQSVAAMQATNIGSSYDADPLPLRFSYNSTPEAYKLAIKACQSHIADGNSYELCLTGQYSASSSGSSLSYISMYKQFRTQNPASHAAFVFFPATQTTIMSCSPELFIRFDGENGRHAVMKPIKGTLKRSKCRCGGLCKVPACGSRKAECDAARHKKDEERVRAFVNDPKETAENLMIADLIRANLLEFCDPSSVDVTKLFALEAYENVYSLVSTITGEIPPSVGPVEGIRRCFPPGSMTGAPKLRSVQLLDTLETPSRRGIYSGCLGFLSLDDRSVFSVVIRTLIAHRDELSYGAGGAITWLSDVNGEWAEVVLKAQSVLKGRIARAG